MKKFFEKISGITNFKAFMRPFGLLFYVLLIIFVLAVSLRGQLGNPNEQDLNTPKWHDNGPFELSPERGRFALAYSFIENHSFYFSVPVARFATPDLGYINGKYVSLFAPAISFLTLPGYILGKYFGISQVGAFAVIALFATFNVLLVKLIAQRLGANSMASGISGLVFLFGTPAFTYGVTLYQHHVSTFLILSTLFILLKWKNWIALGMVWLLFAASIPVDYPNLVLMAPLALFATTRILWAEKEKRKIVIHLKPLNIFTPIFMLLPLFFYVWFSQNSFGKPFQLAGTVMSVDAINAHGKPVINSKLVTDSNVEKFVAPQKEQKQSALGFFQTRNILNGFYVHFLSPDRGIIFFTPIMLFAIVGSFALWRKNQTVLALLIGVIGADILLYSMWGDPWGGWAFGSRYLIPAFAMGSVLVAMALQKYGKNKFFITVFVTVVIYSVWVNTLGALTTSTNPPQVQILSLEQQTHIQQKYTYERNIDYLEQSGSKSFAYNTFFKKYVTPTQFYLMVATIVSVVISFPVIALSRNKYE